MPDYSNGKIYSVRFYENDKLLYIGSTIQPLAKRFGEHKKKLDCSLCQYVQENYNGDFKCCYIELLEYYECNNKTELNKREGELIRKYKADIDYIVINKNIAGRTKKEYTQENTDRIKQYYQENADRIKERKKEYYQENTDRIRQYRHNNTDRIKQYYQDNIDKIKEQKKQHYQKKKAEAEANK